MNPDPVRQSQGGPTTTEYRRRRAIARAFGTALRDTRAERGISQNMLSELCDLDRTYPSLLERGLRAPTLAMVFRLAEALGVEETVLIAGARNNLLREAFGRSGEAPNNAHRVK